MARVCKSLPAFWHGHQHRDHRSKKGREKRRPIHFKSKLRLGLLEAEQYDKEMVFIRRTWKM